MGDRDDVDMSRLLSFALRHRPQDFGLVLDSAGWVDLDAVIDGLSRESPCDRETIVGIVRRSDKQRFQLSEDGRSIRAVQGHSVPVELEHPQATPPPLLFHGTVERSLASIMKSGLLPGRRHDVHLSPTREVAGVVGSRRGNPVVLLIDAEAMSREGHAFRLAPNGVWLCSEVPPQFLRIEGEPQGLED